MKKRLLVFSLIICVLVTLTGCSVTSDIAWYKFKIADTKLKKIDDKRAKQEAKGLEFSEEDRAKRINAHRKASDAYLEYLQACVDSGELTLDQIPLGTYGKRAETLSTTPVGDRGSRAQTVTYAWLDEEDSELHPRSEDSESTSASDKSTIPIIIIAIVIIVLLLLLLMRKKQPSAYAVPVVNTPQVIPPSVPVNPQPYVGYYDQNAAMQEINSYCAANNLDTQTFIKQCGSVDAAIVTIRGYQ